ncbi:S-methyl-5-thioribose-1-phosphate isomerase [Streptomyces spectabilis]|uniref:Methylthioribose-1-phosphate isomerase n=1 Tax=Streptomyces spectabilis TaxID=68270 RepID=A0A5P2X1R1_STRST|nr:S-methyl-5-thioribose-1-phosphate isomerase [Streptomyces spectabilis]MBB5105973.1 methylthioribose-1-phosphate isomerase [Streptomyces spectabilis]MCI3901505.1 S-methyl-5-thioribose-1-phosphate isomerase [Streptomyces spectabilis]QEV58967.1 S-methyl-5-thioribose-1-phosphate isomerase [Streptomyces spectabilis]GGV25174.1 methylthioribose-1-phosphate isomerase [Streptomyces spectabilis]
MSQASNEELRAVVWRVTARGPGLALIDQTALPHALRRLDVHTVDQLVDAIVRLVVRGAPALGAAGAYGVALALVQGEREGWGRARVDAEVARVRAARPTAVNLMTCVDRAAARLDEGLGAVLAEADAVVEEDLAANHAMGRHGADWLLERLGRDRPLRVLTHCNTGALATAGWGTALGVIRELHRRDRLQAVYADETRPLLQGARLTAWELARAGIPHYVQADAAAAGVILRGEVDAAVVGADRIAANGDTANKVGTVGIALACAHAGIPFVVAAPTTTVDLATASGADIPIELRAADEVLEWAGVRTAPADSRGHNPAFDVTPGALVTALVTERGVREVAKGELPL